MQKLFLTAFLAALVLLSAGAIWPRATPPQGADQPSQQAPATKMVSGKVSAIGNGGQSFALEVSSGGGSQTMQFIVDKNAKIEGRVTVGTPVTVEYIAMEGGQFRAVSITAQG